MLGFLHFKLWAVFTVGLLVSVCSAKTASAFVVPDNAGFGGANGFYEMNLFDTFGGNTYPIVFSGEDPQLALTDLSGLIYGVEVTVTNNSGFNVDVEVLVTDSDSDFAFMSKPVGNTLSQGYSFFTNGLIYITDILITGSHLEGPYDLSATVIAGTFLRAGYGFEPAQPPPGIGPEANFQPFTPGGLGPAPTGVPEIPIGFQFPLIGSLACVLYILRRRFTHRR